MAKHPDIGALSEEDRAFVELVAARAAAVVIHSLAGILGGVPEPTDQELLATTQAAFNVIRDGM